MTLAVALLAVAALAMLFAHGVRTQGATNTDAYAGDQSEYLAYAQALATHPDQSVQDRAQMPLFPWVLTRTVAVEARPGDTVGAPEFEAAKRVGTALALLVLVGVTAWSWKRSGPLVAAFTATFVAFGLLVFKAPWVQADLLAYGLLALTLAAMVRALRSPGAIAGALVGLLAGLTMLAKPSATPAILGFLLAAAVGTALGRRRAHAAMLAAAALLFVAVMAPYGATSDRFYGTPTYNRNSTYYLWLDSWKEIQREAEQHHDNIAPLDLPADEMPTMRNYLRQHSFGDIVHREAGGIPTTAANVADLGWGVPLGLLALSVVGVAILERRRLVARVRAEPQVAVFATIVPLVYLAGWAWWVPIDPGPRFVMSLFIPATISGVALVWRGLRSRTITIRGRTLPAAAVWLGGFSLLLVPFVLRAALHLAGTVDGGV